MLSPLHPRADLGKSLHYDACCVPFTLGGLGPRPHQPFKLTSQFFYIELRGSRGASPAGKVASGTKLSRLKGVLSLRV